MGRIEKRYPWVYLVVSVLLIANAGIWIVEGISQGQNAYLSVVFTGLSLLGSGVCYSLWWKYRTANEHES